MFLLLFLVSLQKCGGLRERARGGVEKHSAVPVESDQRLSIGETADHGLETGRGADHPGRGQVFRGEYNQLEERP